MKFIDLFKHCYMKLNNDNSESNKWKEKTLINNFK